MTYTQDQLEGMSDFMINKEAALFFHKHEDSIALHESPSEDCSVWVKCDGGLINTNYNPCNNWNDCGALIDECGIGIIHGVNCVIAANGRHVSASENIKRAVAIVYILIKQGG